MCANNTRRLIKAFLFFSFLSGRSGVDVGCVVHLFAFPKLENKSLVMELEYKYENAVDYRCGGPLIEAYWFHFGKAT